LLPIAGILLKQPSTIFFGSIALKSAEFQSEGPVRQDSVMIAPHSRPIAHPLLG